MQAVLSPQLRFEIKELIDERIYEKHVTREDFSELKNIVKETVKIQKEIAEKVEDLSDAQKRTEVKVEELADAQKRTEVKVEELADAQKRTEVEIQKLTRGLKETRGELGGLSRSMIYAFENEVYRMLPVILKNVYGIEMAEKLIRAEIGGKEINILGRARKNGQKIVLIGETKLRLDERRKKEDVFEELEEKVSAVKEEYREDPFRVLVTHYATPGFIEKAKKKDVIVIQSFEW
ncbi:MAG: hypothetical protein QME42_08165 [bacterium]|nr:hypothetical protein [bacterium]